MLAILALIVLVGKLVADGYLPVWTFYLVLVLAILGGLGGASRMISHVLRVGVGLAAAIAFLMVLRGTHPDLVRPYLEIMLQVLVIYLMVWALARAISVVLTGERLGRR